MFLQEGPAETFGYMALGFGVIFATLAVFLASLITRFRNQARDLALLEEMEAGGAGETRTADAGR